MSCGIHLSWEKRREVFAERGLTARGNDPVDVEVRRIENKNCWQRKKRGTELGRYISNLYSSLRNMLRGGYNSRHFEFSAEQLREHINGELERFNFSCPLCGLDLKTSKWNIDHHIPIREAQTKEEALRLFSLQNLSVLCVDCNQRVKRGKRMSYGETTSEKGGLTQLATQSGLGSS
jgi:5-methylcytosine-specific restriction endonuclease McrA